MAWRDWSNPPVQSTQALATDPSTATLIAEVQSLENKLYEVRWCVGASTAAIFRLDHALSSGLGSTGARDRTVVFTGSNQSAEYVFAYRAESGDRFRVTVESSFSGSVFAKISAEVLS